MMKCGKAIVGLLCCCAALCCATAWADCGKMWIYPYQWENWPRGGGQTDIGHGTPDVSNWTGGGSGSQSQGGSSTVTVNVGQLQAQYDQLLQQVASLQNLVNELRKKLDASDATTVPGGSGDGGVLENPGNQGTDTDDSGDVSEGFEPYHPDKNGKGPVPFGYFNEDAQQAVISWNGKNNDNGRETIILSTNEQIAFNGKTAYLLSVLPLPGMVEKVEPANPKAFLTAKGLFFSKTPEKPRSSTDFAVVYETKIGPHNIFVWELENVETFQRDVQAWVAKHFNGQAAAYIDNNMMRVLQYYINSGFRYFAFDLTEVSNVPGTKLAIAYTFQSTGVYYPLVISRIGGTSEPSTVDLIVMTPGNVSPTPASAIQNVYLPGDKRAQAKDAATLVGGGTVRFSIDEVRSIDKHLDVFDAGTREVKVRNIRFKKPLNSYTKDFILK